MGYTRQQIACLKADAINFAPDNNVAVEMLADTALELMDLVEQLRVQLAGCSAAALGYGNTPTPVTPDSYGYSVAFADVQRLYEKKEELRQEFEAERKRCLDIASALRRGQLDDVRSVVQMIQSGADLHTGRGRLTMITAPQIADAVEPPTPPSPITSEDRAAVCADYFGDANLLVDVRRWRETGEVGEADELARLERLALSRAQMRLGEAFGAQVAEVLMPAETAAPDSTLTALVAKWREHAARFPETQRDCIVMCADELEAALRQQASAPGQAFQVTPEDLARFQCEWWERFHGSDESWTGMPEETRDAGVQMARATLQFLAARPSAPAPSGAVEVPSRHTLIAEAADRFEALGEYDCEALADWIQELLQRPAPSAPSAQAWTRGLASDLCTAYEALTDARGPKQELRETMFLAGARLFGAAAPVASAQGGDDERYRFAVQRSDEHLRALEICRERANAAERDLAAERAAHRTTSTRLNQRSACLEATTVRKATAEQAAADWQGRAEAAEKRAAELEQELAVAVQHEGNVRTALRATENELAACKAKLEGLREACTLRNGEQSAYAHRVSLGLSAPQIVALAMKRIQAALTATKPTEGPKAGDVLTGEQAKAFMLANPGREVAPSFDDGSWSYTVLPPDPVKPAVPSPVEPDPDAPKDVEALPSYWDARRKVQGKPDASRCAAELRVALGAGPSAVDVEALARALKAMHEALEESPNGYFYFVGGTTEAKRLAAAMAALDGKGGSDAE